MAGVKGRSGGARPNSGPKPKEPEFVYVPATEDPLVFLRSIMNDEGSDSKLRVDAAKALLPFVHQKLGEGGKKEQRQKDAESVAGRFSSAAPPKLVAAGGRKV